jgi:hypothetical protein
MSMDAISAYGTTIGIWERQRVRFVLEGVSSPHALTASTIRILSEVIRAIGRDHVRGVLFIQYEDIVRNNMYSVSFGKRKNEAPAVTLIPDIFFLNSHGYQALRNAVHSKTLPSWNARKDVIFWRGSATTRGVSSTGAAVERLDQIPRVELCVLLRGVANADAAICAPFGFQFDPNSAMEWFTEERIFRPAVAPVSMAQYRYLIDIDGVANAWGFFEKLLLGSCILKVKSDYEQWFYDMITAWDHFVPVSEDLSDLIEKIDWCRKNVEKAAEIGARGQAFALSYDFAVAKACMLEAAKKCFIPY